MKCIVGNPQYCLFMLTYRRFWYLNDSLQYQGPITNKFLRDTDENPQIITSTYCVNVFCPL